MAISADGKVAARGAAGSGFGSAADQRRLVELRSPADALLVGQATLQADHMSMNLASRPDLVAARQAQGKPEHPARVVVARRPDFARLGQLAAKPGGLVWLVAPADGIQNTPLPDGVAVCECPPPDTDTCDEVVAALRGLAGREGWRHIHCEGGPRLARRLLSAGAVDTLFLTIVPILFGGHSAPTITGPAWIDSFARSSKWRMTASETGPDGECFLTYEALSSSSSSE